MAEAVRIQVDEDVLLKILTLAREVSQDLQVEVDARYKDTLNYPTQRRRFERDIEPASTLIDLIGKIEADL